MSDLVRRTQEQQAAHEPSRVEQFIRNEQRELENAIAGRIGVDRFIAAAVATFKQSAKLAKTTPESRLGALYTAAQLGLEVGGPRGLVYFVPYGNETSVVVGYRGFVDLFYRAGAKGVDWFVVREGDHFRIGSDAIRGYVYEWAPPGGIPDEKRPWTGVVAQVRTANGGIVWEFMTKAQVLARRPKPIPAPWKAWEEQMALKTVLRQLAKRVPMSTDLALAQDADETIQRRIPGLEEHAVQHLPVEGGNPPEHFPGGKSIPAPDLPEQAPPLADEELAEEERSRREYAEWRAEHPEEDQ